MSLSDPTTILTYGAPLILLIDDDPAILALLRAKLEAENYRVESAENAVKGLIAARQLQPDLILLDRQLPDMEGVEICKRLRKSSDVPIILLTSLDQPDQRIGGLDSGADDYVTKPFDPQELLARIRVQFRRHQKTQTLLEWQDLRIDEKLHQVYWRKKPIELTPKEYDLLRLFLQHPEEVLNRGRIVKEVWGWESQGQDKVLDVSMHTLRDKIEQVSKMRLIQTIRGIGYILQLPAGAEHSQTE